MKRSGRNNACPSCGRTSDSDCAWADDVLFCHQGSSCGPDPSLRVGDLITIDGQPWALVKVNAGFSGAAHVFKPHQELPTNQKSAANREQILDHRARRAVAALSIERFFKSFDRAWNVPDLHSLDPSQLAEADQVIRHAHAISLEMAPTIHKVWRDHRDLAELYRYQFEAAVKSIRHQINDLNDFRRIYLGEVV